MNCPVCAKEMVPEDFGGTEVNVCRNGCMGLWLDWMEVRKLDETCEGCGALLQEAMASPRAHDDNRGPLKCPKCGLVMHRHRYDHAAAVEVDECYACGGFFLDSGELKAMREDRMTDAQRADYGRQMVNQAPLYQQAELDLERRQARSTTLYRLSSLFGRMYY